MAAPKEVAGRLTLREAWLLLDIIPPAGFENYFRELGAELISAP
jgi:hypothetical protein